MPIKNSVETTGEENSYEQFTEIVSIESLLNEYYRFIIYDSLRKKFSPEQIIEYMVKFLSDYDLDDLANERIIVAGEKIIEKAESEIPFNEVYHESLIIERFSKLYDSLGSIALSLSTVFIIVEGFGAQFRDNTLFTTHFPLLGNVLFEHVGNAGNSYFLLMEAMAVMAIAEKSLGLDKVKLSEIFILSEVVKKLIEVGRMLFPYIVITLALAYQIDAETAQKLPGSFGHPDLLDIPVGLISVIGLAKVLEIKRYHRHHSMPLLEQTTKKIAESLYYLPLLFLALLPLITSSGRGLLAAKTVMRDSAPPKNNPVQVLRKKDRK